MPTNPESRIRIRSALVAEPMGVVPMVMYGPCALSDQFSAAEKLRLALELLENAVVPVRQNIRRDASVDVSII